MKPQMVIHVAPIVATVILTAVCWGQESNAMVKASERWTLPREGASVLSVDDPVGTVRVTTTEGNGIQIDAVKQVRADSVADGQAFLAQMKIERRREGDRWFVAASWPSPERHGVGSPRVDFEFRVPRGIDLEVGMVAGFIGVAGIRVAHLHLNAGVVHAENVRGRLQVETNAGPIEATDDGEAVLRTNVGKITARNIDGRLEAHSNVGSIWLEQCTGPVEATSNMGSITIRQPHGQLNVATAHGSIDAEVGRATEALHLDLTAGKEIELRLPESVSARLEADAGQGISMEPVGRGQFNVQRTHLVAVLGSGRGSVRLHAGRGAIQIRLAGEE